MNLIKPLTFEHLKILYFKMSMTHEHDHDLSIIMRIAAVKSGQLGLFFLVTTLEKRCQPIYYNGI